MTFEDPLSRIIAQRCNENFGNVTAGLPPSEAVQVPTQFPLEFQHDLDLPLNMDIAGELAGFLDDTDHPDFAELLNLQPDELLWEQDATPSDSLKRKPADSLSSDRTVKCKRDSLGVNDAFDEKSAWRDSVTRSPSHSGFENFTQESESCHPGSQTRGQYALDVYRSASPCSDVSEQSCVGQSVEYHLQKIQDHVSLAIEALRHGQYGHKKSIVTWAHELKNKTFSELKKEAERAWDAEKDREATPSSRPKNLHGSTKRVEQFRKNMRRWMIGIQAHQIGVEWMVYARMEHLLSISKFILGDALPSDPASPTAVAESIMKHLGRELPLNFLDSQLAEPEPGKRYAIGPELAAHLQNVRPRKVPTLAFTMPADGDEAATADWVAQLKSLFPVKPVPKAKAASAAAT